jgi:hypothetical protein
MDDMNETTVAKKLLSMLENVLHWYNEDDNGEGSLPEADGPFAIQAVTKQDFGPTLSTVWYIREGKGFQIDHTNNAGGTIKHSNDYKNFKCKAHTCYFEVNLYTQEGVSYHHESTRSGRSYSRDASIDKVGGSGCDAQKSARSDARKQIREIRSDAWKQIRAL